VTARSAGGRALSVLPPHHVVLARRDQLLRDLPSAFGRLREIYGGDYQALCRSSLVRAGPETLSVFWSWGRMAAQADDPLLLKMALRAFSRNGV